MEERCGRVRGCVEWFGSGVEGSEGCVERSVSGVEAGAGEGGCACGV